MIAADDNTYTLGATGGNSTHKHTFSLKGTKDYVLNTWGCHVVSASSVDGTSSATFSTSTDSNMPPYLTVSVWKRIG